MSMFESCVSVEHDELIGGVQLPLLNKNIAVSAGSALKRGTIVDKTGAIVKAAADEGTPATVAYGIVASDVSAEDEVVTIYTTGLFNREKLIVSDGDTVDAHEDELRTVGIYLTSVQ